MKRLTRWMVARYLPAYEIVEKPVNLDDARWLIQKYQPDYHLAKNPPKGEARKLAREAKIKIEVIPDGDNPGLEGVATEGPEGVSE